MFSDKKDKLIQPSFNVSKNNLSFSVHIMWCSELKITEGGK